MDESEADVLVCMAFPARPSTKLPSTKLHRTKLHRGKLPSNQAAPRQVAQQPSCTAASRAAQTRWNA